MTVAFAIAAGLLVAAAVFLMLDRNLVRYVLGLVLLGNGVNLVLLLAGGLVAPAPPAFVPPGLESPVGPVANPLPQALVLTAIVIGFALLAFALLLTARAGEALETTDSEEMRVAEPRAAAASTARGADAAPAAAALAPDGEEGRP